MKSEGDSGTGKRRQGERRKACSETERQRERKRKIRQSENSERGEVRTGPKPEEENDKRLQKER